MKLLAVSAFAIAQLIGSYAQNVCPSGQSGEPCVDITNTCEAATAVPLATKPIAEFMESLSSIAKNVITLEIHSDHTANRFINSINILSPEGKAAQGNFCKYDRLNAVNANYTRTFDFSGSPCFEKFVSKFSFQELIRCGLTGESISPYEDVYSGIVTLTGTDQVGKLRSNLISRETTSSLLLEISVPKNVTIDYDVTVISEIVLQAAVTKQSYDAVTQSLTLEITTDVQNPYRLAGTTGLSSPAGLDMTISDPEDTCNDNDPDCLQVYTITVSGISSPSLCTFSGDYSFSSFYGCHGSFTNCPVAADSTTSPIQFTLNTGDVCAKIRIESKIDGQMTSSTKDDYSDETAVFVAGQTAFFRATVTSDVDVSAIDITTVTVIFNNIPQVVSQGQMATDVNYLPGIITTTTADFSFEMLLDKLFGAVTGDEIYSFVVEVDLAITYRTTFKRDIRQESQKLSQQFFVDASGISSQAFEASQEGSGSSIIFPAAALLSGGIVLNNF